MESMQNRVNGLLEKTLTEGKKSSRIMRAARYSVLAGGKKLRPCLVYAASFATNGSLTAADSSAIAVELVHAYSLIHDDLPAMDDDKLRRGQPTTHIAFGESYAILAGDALQALAFDILAGSRLNMSMRLKQIQLLSQAISFNGMAFGQELDLLAENKKQELPELEFMHACKTGSLIKASVLMGAVVGKNESSEIKNSLCKYAENVGLAFQIHDDILDITGTTKQLGKNIKRDENLGKLTFPALIGLNASKKRAKELIDEALEVLHSIPGNQVPLKGLAKRIIERTN